MTDELVLTPEQIEAEMIKRELETQKALDGYASFFYMYIHRFQEQIKMMSKKQLITLVVTLSSSEVNKQEKLKDLKRVALNLNLKSLVRTISNVIENPLNESAIKTFSKEEKKFFNLLENLLAEKYISSIENVKDSKVDLTISDVVKHSVDSKEFNKRDKLEKDAFATGNQLLFGKFTMIRFTMLEELDRMSTEVNQREENGTKNQTTS